MAENPYDLSGPGGQFQDVVGAALGGATIAPVKKVHHVTSTTAITTITPPHEGFTGPVYLIADSQFTITSTGGNMQEALATTVAGHAYPFIYDRKTGKWYQCF